MSALIDLVSVANPIHRLPLPLRPPGMTGEDVSLYLDWRTAPHVTPVAAFFNVRVGPPVEHLTRGGTSEHALRAQLLAPRIDMLLWSGSCWWVVEFHVNMQLAQLGRLIGYPSLLRQTYPTSEPIRSLAVARVCNPWLVPIFTMAAIPVLTYSGFPPMMGVCNPSVL